MSRLVEASRLLASDAKISESDIALIPSGQLAVLESRLDGACKRIKAQTEAILKDTRIIADAQKHQLERLAMHRTREKVLMAFEMTQKVSPSLAHKLRASIAHVDIEIVESGAGLRQAETYERASSCDLEEGDSEETCWEITIWLSDSARKEPLFYFSAKASQKREHSSGKVYFCEPPTLESIDFVLANKPFLPVGPLNYEAFLMTICHGAVCASNMPKALAAEVISALYGEYISEHHLEEEYPLEEYTELFSDAEDDDPDYVKRIRSNLGALSENIDDSCLE